MNTQSTWFPWMYYLGWIIITTHASIEAPTYKTYKEYLVQTDNKVWASETLPKAWSYFYPVWDNSRPKIHPSAELEHLQPGLAFSSYDIVQDPLNRIEHEFEASPKIRDRVLFWIDIYTKYNSKVRVIHDRTRPEITYGYIDFTPIYRQSKTKATAAWRSRKIEKEVLRLLKAKLAESMGLSSKSAMTTSEKGAIPEFLKEVSLRGNYRPHELLKDIRTQLGQRDSFILALSRSQNLLPQIESTFRQNGIPVGLARIPFVESSFNNRARSRVGAIGMFQFMPATAREVIHRKNKALWADPISQVQGAVRLLRQYKNVLPDWGSVAISYNSGVGRVSKIMQKHDIDNAIDLVTSPETSGRLGFAGKNYLAELMAANFVEAYKTAIFSTAMVPDNYFSLNTNLVLPNAFACR